MFENREDAGRLLAKRFKNLNGNLIVLAIPRGGVVVGKILSQELGCPLDVLVVKKIGAPGNPELAVGAMGPDGKAVWNEDIMKQLGLTPERMSSEMQNAKYKIQDYKAKFKTPKFNLKAKIVILTDDGIATGATIEAAIAWIKTQSPAKIALAVPVAPPEVIENLKDLVDELVVLETPENFSAVGQFYRDFHPVTDEVVIKLIDQI